MQAVEAAAAVALITVGAVTGQPELIAIGVSLGVSAVAGFIAPTPAVPQLGPGGMQVNVKNSDAPWRVIYGKTRVGGVIRFLHVTGPDKAYLHLIIVLAAHEINSIGAMYRDGEQVTDANGNPLAKWGSERFLIVKRYGTDDQTAVTELVDAAPDKWTVDHRLRGLAYVYVRVKWSADKFAGRLGDLTFDVEGNNQVYDPRTETSGYSTNPALCLADYITNSKYGMGADYADLDSDDLTASANACEEQVDLADTGSPPDTQNRFACNGAIDLNVSHADVLRPLASSMAGKVVPVGGTWRILAGVWREPTLTIDEDNLRGSLSVNVKRAGADLYNTVTGTFVGEETDYQPTDFVPVSAQTWLDEDQGIEKDGDVPLPFVDNHNQVRRVAKVMLSQMRRQTTVQWPGDLSCYRLRPGDTVYVNNDNFGWSGKTFEVSTLTFSTEEDNNGVPRLVTDLQLQESDSNVYDWTTADEEPPPAASTTDLPDPSVVASPDQVSLASGPDYSFKRKDGTWFSRLFVSWPPPNDTFVVDGGWIEVQYRQSTTTAWQPATTVSGDQTYTYILDVQDGQSYQVRLRSVNYAGAKGAWVQSADAIVQGKTTATLDLDADSFDVQRLADGTRQFTWAFTSPPADLAGYKIRYAEGTSSTWSSMSPLHQGLLTSSPFETNQLAAGTYSFAIKAFDRSDNESADAQYVVGLTIGDPRLRSSVLVRDEKALGFPGTKTDCYVAGDTGRLSATGSQTWADLASTWAGLADSWRGIVTSNSPITYETPEIDIGFEASFTPIVDVTATGTVTKTMRAGADHVDGSPPGTYGSVTQVSGVRYIQFKIEVAGTTPEVSAMGINLDAELKTAAYENLDTSGSTGTPAGFEHIATGHFKVETRGQIANITQATLVLQNVGAGYTWELISKTTTITGGSNPAAEFKVYDDTGTLADATVDVLIRGLSS